MRVRDDTGARARERPMLPRLAKTVVSAADRIGCGFIADMSGRELAGHVASPSLAGTGWIWRSEIDGCSMADHHGSLRPIEAARKTSALNGAFAEVADRVTEWVTLSLLLLRQLSTAPAGAPSGQRKLFVVNASRIDELIVEFRIPGGSAGLVRPPGQSRHRWPRFALVAEGTAVDAGAPLAQTRQQQGPT